MTEARTLYALLPELYRHRDAATGYALRALCEVLDGAAAAIERDIGALYDNWFVETCELWALPYIARLVGIDVPPEGALDPRLLVADAIALARRKGTVPGLEHRLSALSGWPVEIVSSPPRRTAVARYWPDPAFPLRGVPPFAEGGGRFRFHPLGLDCPLFAAPRPRRGIETPFEAQDDAPRPLQRTPAALHALSIHLADEEGRLQALGEGDLAVADLSEWGIGSAEGARAVVDPLLGRFIMRDDARGRPVAVSFAYPAPGMIGGGPYPRADGDPGDGCWIAFVHQEALAEQAPRGAPQVFASLVDALDAYREGRGDGVIRILDSGSYDLGSCALDADALPCAPDPNRPRRLVIEALDGETPVLRGKLAVAGGAAGVALTLRGLWLDGWIALSGSVSAAVEHCTIQRLSALRARSGREGASASVRFSRAGPAAASLSLRACLCGPLDIGAGVALTIADSVVDGYGGAAIAGRGEAALSRATVLGDSEFASVEALDTLFNGGVVVKTAGEGRVASCACLRIESGIGQTHCVLGPGKWAFRSTDFGSPGYGRLRQRGSEALLTAASNGSEIGVFNSDHAQRRLGLLAAALAEGLPLGIGFELEAQ